ncbi:hypothetical protein GC106_1760 [Kibdelosporangium sp. 4NS15]|uniref:DUF5709 domain-containing protein n=1 Tax=Kibdelosporangium persicum TaxID=2698649 RepID=A0ABX2EVW0_9PSEU|nr:hypothetical protein [Kibdelosporangium persicum]NRN62975.1 hypothetical protein [Kibdelosporangium persicum]
MTSEYDSPTPPHDTGEPDPVERDPAALSAAEDLDEDRLRVDPLEAGMDPPERWSGADKYGTTPYEQAHPRPFGERLEEEEPDAQPERPSPLDDEVAREASDRGQLADEAGGSMAAEQRTPPRQAE